MFFRPRMEYSCFPSKRFGEIFWLFWIIKNFFFFLTLYRGIKYTARWCVDLCHVTLESLSKDEGNDNTRTKWYDFWLRENNRAAGVVRTLVEFFDVVYQTTLWNFQN